MGRSSKLRSMLIFVWKIFLRQNRDGLVYIRSDSHVALTIFTSYLITSKLVLECVKAMSELVKDNRVILMWVPRHRSIPRNEIADQLKKKGSEAMCTGQCSGKWMAKRHKHYQNHIHVRRHSRQMLSKQSLRLVSGILSSYRTQTRAATCISTEHDCLKSTCIQ